MTIIGSWPPGPTLVPGVSFNQTILKDKHSFVFVHPVSKLDYTTKTEIVPYKAFVYIGYSFLLNNCNYRGAFKYEKRYFLLS